jgi:4-amino-4-deoxy-L-arabinose transferase-like glycosyltransferase
MSRDRVLMMTLAVIALSIFITPWTRELFVGDETKYAQVVREMRAGSFFLPTLEGTPFTHKPPLHFWMIDALTYLFGVSSLWPFVLPAIAGFLVLLWLMLRMEGPIAAFVCCTSLLLWGSAQTARMDVTFTAAIAIAAWMLQRFLDDGERRLLVLAGVWLGIATLLKGPMAPVIAVFLFAFEWIRRRRVPRGNYAVAIIVMIVIPLLWFVPAMIIGGHDYTREVLLKQTAGRAIGAWVHRSPFWYYVAHAPADLFPWFLLFIVAVIAAFRGGDERAKFYVSWVLAVLVPYSAMSSKLDVYMMAMIPPAALLITRLVARDDPWAWRVNLLMLIGLTAPQITVVTRLQPIMVSLKPLFIAIAACAAAGIIISLSTRSAAVSTIALGLVMVVSFTCSAPFLIPAANEYATDRPIVRALVAQHVTPEQIALYTAPHLWTRDMPRVLERVRYVSPEDLRKSAPTVIVTSRGHADEIAGILRTYRKVDQFEILGKPFDVYRR